MVDDRCGVITEVATTAGDVTEGARVAPLVTQHEANAGEEIAAMVGSRGYGTV